ncbi:MAG: GNAT family N-acetyltransferase [Psychrobium sp.]|nr:GNAT family N-acetyltransferase [Psychrobium sp.]
MNFQRIEHNSAQYQQSLQLRHNVLRKPLKLDLFTEDLSQETDYLHFALINEQQVVACLIIVVSGTQARLKQMAVSPDDQGQGLGRKLIEQVEQYLSRLGMSTITLAARTNAIGFYHQLNYVAHGEPFIEVSISHQMMSKNIEKIVAMRDRIKI